MALNGAKKGAKRAPAWQAVKSPLNLYRDDLREALGRSGKTLAAMRRAVNEHGAGGPPLLGPAPEGCQAPGDRSGASPGPAGVGFAEACIPGYSPAQPEANRS